MICLEDVGIVLAYLEEKKYVTAELYLRNVIKEERKIKSEDECDVEIKQRKWI